MKPITSRRRFAVDLAPDALWDQLSAVDEFTAWWPWLRQFAGAPPRAGVVWSCTVRPPLLYQVRFEVHLGEVVAGQWLDAAVSGDVAGRAALELVPAGAGTEVTLTSELAPRRRLLRALGLVAPGVARHGHDWVLTRAALDFPGGVRSITGEASDQNRGGRFSVRAATPSA